MKRVWHLQKTAEWAKDGHLILSGCLMIDARRCKSERNARSVCGWDAHYLATTNSHHFAFECTTHSSVVYAGLSALSLSSPSSAGRFSLRPRSSCGATAEMRAFSAAAPVGPILHSRSIDDAGHDAPCMTMQTGRFFSSCRYAIAQAHVHP